MSAPETPETQPDLSFTALRDRLAAFLFAELGRPVQILSGERFPAGLSWLTFALAVRWGGPEPREEPLILRVGDPAGLLAPYRAEPEFRVFSVLSDVPDLRVPRAIAFSDDVAILGAPFLVTSRVEGDTPGPWSAARRPASEIDSLGRDFAASLAAIHRFDWRATALARLWGDPPGASVARAEVRRWAEHASLTDGRGEPQLHYAWRWLDAHAPPATVVTIVHGDYRVGNFLQHEGRITAILDWELVHAGDPHEDLAWAAARTFAAGTDRVGGLFDRQQLLRRYSELTGLVIQPEVLHFYGVLAQFKMAAMLVGGIRRVDRGTVRDVRVAAMGFQVPATLLELNRLIGVSP